MPSKALHLTGNRRDFSTILPWLSLLNASSPSGPARELGRSNKIWPSESPTRRFT